MQGAMITIHVGDVPIERMEKRDGWAISEFRLPVGGAHGSSTTVFHSIFRPGSTHAKHLHRNCDEICVYLEGHGVVGQGDSRAEVGPGHCRLMPRGSTHFFYNETKQKDAVCIGFYVGAANVTRTTGMCAAATSSRPIWPCRAAVSTRAFTSGWRISRRWMPRT